MKRAFHCQARCIGALLLLASCVHAGAHPLGNNTVSRQAVIDLSERQVALTYRMDMAEIPTLAAADEADRNGDGATTRAEWQAHAARWSRDVARSLTLVVDGRTIGPLAGVSRFRLGTGEAGLATLFLETDLAAPIPAGPKHGLRYRDDFRPRDAGWKEVMVRERQAARLIGAVARSDRSHGLTRYPKDGALPQELAAAFEIEWAPPPRQAGSATPNAAVAQSVPGLPPSVAATLPDARRGTGLRDDAARTERDAPVSASPGSFFVLGMHHIATGFDHLAFLLGLLLLSQRTRELVKLISAFTAAHSVTLILAAGGLVSPPGTWVEPAIAFTIAYVGFIAWRQRTAGHGVALAFLFGLIHGFGFAGALAETLGDTTRGTRWLVDLLAFNLGIEAFQIILVLCALALGARVRAMPWRAAAHTAVSLAVFGLGITWLALRLLEPGQT